MKTFVMLVGFGLFSFFLGAVCFRTDSRMRQPESQTAVTVTNVTTNTVAVTAPAKSSLRSDDGELKPLSELMPTWAIKSNSPNDFQITFKAYNKKEWDTATNHFQTEAAALSVIESSKSTLRIQYEVGKALSDSLGRMAERKRK